MIIVTLNGGLVQSVSTDKPELLKEEVIVVDYDAEGDDDYVIDKDGCECCPRREPMEEASADVVKDLVKITDEREAMRPED